MASLAKKTIQHFTHSHPLVEVSVDTEFLCNGCKTLGFGKRYRCEHCNFDLHDHCGTCPMELSSFMHDHGLKLLVHDAQGARRTDRFCNFCGEFVEGLFYRCSICDFDVHPLCTQLPQEVRHVMHRDHPLRLQRSAPGQYCMVCYGTCASWHYRCGLCSFDLHFECVLAPCEKASRSFKTTIPPQSSPSPGFGAGCGYGFGGTPPPPNFPGAPFAVPYPDPYPNGHGNFHYQYSNGSQGGGGGGGNARKKMYEIVGLLASTGVLTQVIFGAIGSLSGW